MVRIVLIVLIPVFAAVTLLLVVLAVLDLGRADRIGSVAGAIASAAGLVVSVLGLVRYGSSDSPRGAVRVVARGRDSIAAGGSIQANAIGVRSRLSSAAAEASTMLTDSSKTVVARGTGSTAAGGSVSGNAVGYDSEVG